LLSQDPFLNIAPKKLNWDLKREVAERLEILNKKTTRVINEIVAEKMKELEGSDEDQDEDVESDDEVAQSAHNSEEIDLE
jgi:coiled-coil domain-containing protein 12